MRSRSSVTRGKGILALAEVAFVQAHVIADKAAFQGPEGQDSDGSKHRASYGLRGDAAAQGDESRTCRDACRQ